MSDAWAKLGELEKKPFPGGSTAPEEGDLRIDFDKTAYAEMIAHGSQTPDVELCGVLVGQVYSDRHGPWVGVTHVIRGTAATEQGAQVTFTHDTWDHITAEMDAKHVGRRIVGWYHTHPDFGIFLSEMDTFIHKNFFNEPFHVAWVYDPLSGKEGAFHLQGDAFRSAKQYWLGARPRRIAPMVPERDPDAEGSDLARAVQALQATVAALHRSVAQPQEASMPIWAWVLLILVGVGAVAEFSGGGRVFGDRSAVLVFSEDPRTGTQYGVRVYPLAREPGAIMPLYRDAAGDKYYGVEVSPADDDLLSRLGELLERGEAAAPSPSAPRAPPHVAGARQGPGLPTILAAVLAVIAVAVGAVLFVTRRGK